MANSYALVRNLGNASTLPPPCRLLFCVEQACMVPLHGFMKKTKKTPTHNIDLALKRKKGSAT
jgi:phage-related protein